MIAFLNLTESKLKGWTVKYGREEDVQAMRDQYTNYVTRNEIVKEFKKAFSDMQNVVKEYKKDGNIGKTIILAFSIYLKFDR